MTESATNAEQLLAEIGRIQADVRSRLDTIGDAAGVEALRHEVLGRSGTLAALLRQVGSVPEVERASVGTAGNDARRAIEAAVDVRLVELAGGELEARLARETLDMSAPGRPARLGHLHPLMTVERDLREILHGFGFEVLEGPEIETDEMNFELLNIPPDHPSRDLWDTLYVAEPGSVEAGQPRPAEDGTILRTHTSPVQLRAMRELTPPIRVIMPGRCYRYEAVDASHGFEFFQVEGLVVDHDTSLADLKGTLEAFARAMWGPDTRTRFRPGYYPFTEPSVAFDIGCLVCGGSGCPACGRTGWMTILGAGMVHPVVLRNGGLDPDEYQGYAFGMGLDRMALLRHAIPDLRLLMSADLRFLEQFSGGR
jgi:phenylalanyl-tRNA synthetase alpha chain